MANYRGKNVLIQSSRCEAVLLPRACSFDANFTFVGHSSWDRVSTPVFLCLECFSSRDLDWDHGLVRTCLRYATKPFTVDLPRGARIIGG